MWEQSSAPEELVPFAIKNAVAMLKPDYERLCNMLSVRVVKLGSEKSFTLRAYVTALVHHVFPDGADNGLLINALVGEKSLPHKVDATLQALDVLDEDNRMRFKDLRTQCLIARDTLMEAEGKEHPPGERVGSSKAPPVNNTPPALKRLLPGENLLGVSICWQRSHRAFQAYYRDATPCASASSSYGGPRTPADPVQALSIVASLV